MLGRLIRRVWWRVFIRWGVSFFFYAYGMDRRFFEPVLSYSWLASLAADNEKKVILR